MRTNVELNEDLVNTAMKLSKIKTKKEVIQKALEEYVKYLKRIDMASLRGKVKFFPGYEKEV